MGKVPRPPLDRSEKLFPEAISRDLRLKGFNLPDRIRPGPLTDRLSQNRRSSHPVARKPSAVARV